MFTGLICRENCISLLNLLLIAFEQEKSSKQKQKGTTLLGQEYEITMFIVCWVLLSVELPHYVFLRLTGVSFMVMIAVLLCVVSSWVHF